MKTYNNSVVLRNDGTDPSTNNDDMNAGVGVNITVRVASTPTAGQGALASIFDVADVAIGNPMQTDNQGNYTFKVTDGLYDIVIAEGTADETILSSEEIVELITPDFINNLSLPYVFDTVADYKSFATTFPVGKVIKLLDRGAEFTVINGTGTGNNLDILASNTVVQSLQVIDYDGNIKKLGASAGNVLNAEIDRSIVLVNKATLESESFDVLLNAPINLPAEVVIDLGKNSLEKDVSFVSNSDNTYINHAGNEGVVKNVHCDNIGATERLIGYTGADNCIEVGCATGRGTSFLIKFQGVENNNYSNTLDVLSTGNRATLTQSKRMEAIYDADAGTLAFNRVRHLPSRCTITHIKVTDLNGSPNFYFGLAMRDGGGFSYPFISTPFGTGDIDLGVQIDWFYDSFDDLLSFDLRNDKGSPTQFKVEIFYTDAISGRDDTAWTYQSTDDFNRPHQFGASGIIEAVRVPEQRTYIDGVGLDVRGAPTTKSTVVNYGYPETTIATPTGTQDLTGTTSELKFYFHFSAGMALSSGATHVRFRVYQQTRQIKATCINGFLSQKPDWATGAPHLAVSFQPDVEVDFNGATRDVPQEVLIPLDRKAMMNAANEEVEQDLKYFYLTFYQNLAGHVPIQWGDVWEWECDFIRI